MLKKILLKNTREFLKTRSPENLFPIKKFTIKQKKLLSKNDKLKKNYLRFKKEKLNYLKGDLEKKLQATFLINTFEVSGSKKANYKNYQIQQNKIRKINDFLFSMPMIKSEFEKRQTRNSDFKKKLKEKKKLSILYGSLSNNQLNRIFKQAHNLTGNTSENVVFILESRLDVILYRAFFFQSIATAKQWIRHHKILVNSRCVTIPSYNVNFGDIINIQKKSRKNVGNNILKFFLNYGCYFEKFFNKQRELETQLFLSFNEKSVKSTSYFSNSKVKSTINIVKSNLISALKKKIIKYQKFLLFKQKKTFKYFTPKKYFIYNFDIWNIIKKNFYKKKNLNYDKNKTIESCKINLLNAYTYLKTIPSLKSNFSISRSLKSKFSRKNKQQSSLSKRKASSNNVVDTNLNGIFFVYSLKENFKNKLNFPKSKNMGVLSKKNRNIFNEKNHFITSNFYFEKIQNQIKPTNEILLRKSIEKLYKIFSFFNQLSDVNNSHIPTYLFIKQYKKAVSEKLVNKAHSLVKFLKSDFKFFKNKKNTKSEILVNDINNDIVAQTKEILNSFVFSSLLNCVLTLKKTKKLSKQQESFHIQNLSKLNKINYYDILLFLKLKSLFFKNREISYKQNSLENLDFKLLNFKPLNLEISYKTLSIIYLYRSQKILFPCTVDVEFLTKKN